MYILYMQNGPEVQVMDHQTYLTQQEFTVGERARDGIIRPDINVTDTIVLGPDIDFVYVMRKDNRAVVEPIAARLAAETGHDLGELRSILHEEYENFFAELGDIILESMEYRRGDGAIQLHVYDAEGIEKKALDRCKGEVVSADPLKVDVDGVHMMHVSREYLMGGTKSVGLRNRPGTPPMVDQVADIKRSIGNNEFTITDDDSYTGNTMAQLVRALANGGIHTDDVVFDIQMGEPTVLTEGNLKTDAAMTYLTHDGEDIQWKSDLGDPRDFLVGASGLVVRMTNGEPGRVPYVLPFVSPAARMGIPAEEEYAFSEKVLRANFAFFNRVAEKCGRDLTLRHMDDYFAAFMKQTYGFDLDTPLSTVVAWAGQTMHDKRADIEQIGAIQQTFEYMKLPKKLVMLQVDSIPTDQDPAIAEMNQVIGRYGDILRRHSISIGLSSVGEVRDLKQFASQVGLAGCACLGRNGFELTHNEIYFHNRREATVDTTLDIISRLGHTIALLQSTPDASFVQQLEQQLNDLCNELEARTN